MICTQRTLNQQKKLLGFSVVRLQLPGEVVFCVLFTYCVTICVVSVFFLETLMRTCWKLAAEEEYDTER